MITKNIKEDYFELEYKYREYKVPFTLATEYARYKYFNKLNKHFISAFNIDLDKSPNPIGTLLLSGIAMNMNVQDPVFIIFNKELIVQTFDENKNIFELASSETIQALNNKVNKYISKLNSFEFTNRTLTKEITKTDVILQITERNNTRIPINKQIYDKIVNRYINRNPEPMNSNIIDELIWSALFRYKYLGILDGKQGSVNYKELDYLHKNYHVDVELFGSIINTSLKYFCSMFYDIEKYFGSIGNFFDCTLKSGVFEMNPPFTIWMIESSFAHIRKALDNTTNLTVFITIPVWDVHDRLVLNKHCNTNKQTDYQNPNFNTLKGTKYAIIDRLYCQNAYSYTDYVNSKTKAYFSQTNVLVVSNKYKQNEFKLPFLSNNFVTRS